jgi:hypothetical protein
MRSDRPGGLIDGSRAGPAKTSKGSRCRLLPDLLVGSGITRDSQFPFDKMLDVLQAHWPAGVLLAKGLQGFHVTELV